MQSFFAEFSLEAGDGRRENVCIQFVAGCANTIHFNHSQDVAKKFKASPVWESLSGSESWISSTSNPQRSTSTSATIWGSWW